MTHLIFVMFLSCQDQSYTNPQKAAPEKTGAVKQTSPELERAFKSVLTDYEKIRKQQYLIVVVLIIIMYYIILSGFTTIPQA